MRAAPGHRMPPSGWAARDSLPCFQLRYQLRELNRLSPFGPEQPSALLDEVAEALGDELVRKLHRLPGVDSVLIVKWTVQSIQPYGACPFSSGHFVWATDTEIDQDFGAVGTDCQDDSLCDWRLLAHGC